MDVAGERQKDQDNFKMGLTGYDGNIIEQSEIFKVPAGQAINSLLHSFALNLAGPCLVSEVFARSNGAFVGISFHAVHPDATMLPAAGADAAADLASGRTAFATLTPAEVQAGTWEKVTWGENRNWFPNARRLFVRLQAAAPGALRDLEIALRVVSNLS